MIALFAVTAAGRRAAARLAPVLGAELAGGPVAAVLPRLWPRLDAAVFFLATGATVRLVAPLLSDKHTDPAVVCVDEAARFAVALTGGHGGGANGLTRRVADVLGATPVVTTASEAVGATPLDEVVDLLDASVDGDAAAVGVALLDGAGVTLANPLGFPLPALPGVTDVDPQWTIEVTDRAGPLPQHTLRLVPRTLVVGIGSARGVGAAAVRDALALLARVHQVDLRAVRAYASVDVKADEAGILEAVGDKLLTYPAAVLSGVEVPHPSEVVRAAVGTPSVAEAAALHAAAELADGGQVELVAPKVVGEGVTVAAARIRPRGRLALVGLGPGAADLRTPRAETELRRASVVVGLDQYVAAVRHLLRPGAEVRVSGLGQEEARAREAVELARSGRAVALVGSGDAQVYALASPALELAGGDVEVVEVPGVTAALAAAALLGAPLGHDHMLVSLSDLHTPWPVIERRVRAGAEADLVVCFYNPRSRGRAWQLGAALAILAEHRPADTPVGAVRQASREGQRVWCAPLAEFDPVEVDMLTTVVVGSSSTRMVGGRMVTPRGYAWLPAR